MTSRWLRSCPPLPWSAPLWAAVLLTGMRGRRAGLVIVMHHVVTDGLGGLALLAALLDPGAPAGEQPVPVPAPGRRALVAQASPAG
ncbi:MAG: wax ester/triacylglycerol synthase domain-containing protein [Tetrasphaera sp.]